MVYKCNTNLGDFTDGCLYKEFMDYNNGILLIGDSGYVHLITSYNLDYFTKLSEVVEDVRPLDMVIIDETSVTKGYEYLSRPVDHYDIYTSWHLNSRDEVVIDLVNPTGKIYELTWDEISNLNWIFPVDRLIKLDGLREEILNDGFKK